MPHSGCSQSSFGVGICLLGGTTPPRTHAIAEFEHCGISLSGLLTVVQSSALFLSLSGSLSSSLGLRKTRLCGLDAMPGHLWEVKKPAGLQAKTAASSSCCVYSLVVDGALIHQKHLDCLKTGGILLAFFFFFLVLCLFQNMMPQEPTLNFSEVDLCILNQKIDLHAVVVVLFSPPHR